MIGLIAVDFLDLSVEENFTTGGQIVEFTQPFNCECEGGMMRFGNVMIDTDSTEEEYVEDDYDCDEE
jgi:hypothetical protein